MKQFNKEEYNRMCAEFMGYKVIPCGTIPIGKIKHPEISEAFLKFDTDWNWIMEVVDKIESNSYYSKLVVIQGRLCLTQTDNIVSVLKDSKKEAVVKAIWEFLNWYNQQPKN